MPGSSVTSDSSRGCDHHDKDQEPGTLYSLEPETDPEMLPRLGPKMEGARQNNCSKHVLISLGLHLDMRRRIRNFTRIETDRDWTERRARAGGRTDMTMFRATRPDLVQIAEITKALMPQMMIIWVFLRVIMYLILLMGTNWRHKNLLQKREPFKHLCFVH